MQQQDPAWSGPGSRPHYEPVCKIDETIGEKARGKKTAAPAAPFYGAEMLRESGPIRLILAGNWFGQDWERSILHLRRSASQGDPDSGSPVLVKRGGSWALLRPGEKASPKAASHYMGRGRVALFAFEEKEQPPQKTGDKK